MDDISYQEELTWLLKGRLIADGVLGAHESPKSHMDIELLQSGRALVESAIDEAVHGEGLAGAAPEVRQLISEGAYLAYNEWATKNMVFSEDAQSE